ncbi:hypothetical protein LQW54_006385 [Pestalotiopsis sp. IQ-011]
MQDSNMPPEAITSSSRRGFYSGGSNTSLKVVSNRTPSLNSDRTQTGSVRHSLLRGGKLRLDSSDLPVPPVLTRADSMDTITSVALKPDVDRTGGYEVSEVRDTEIGAPSGRYGISKVRPADVEPVPTPDVEQNHYNLLENQSGYFGTSKVRPADVVTHNDSESTPKVRSLMPFMDNRPEHTGRPRYESKVRPVSDGSISSFDDSRLGYNSTHDGHARVGKVQSFHNAPTMVTRDRLQSMPRLVSSQSTPDDSQAEAEHSQAASY